MQNYSCCLTENVGIPLLSFLEVLFCQLFAQFIARIPSLHYAVHFWLCRKNSNRNENVKFVNRPSNSSLYVLFLPKTSAPCAHVRNDRNWCEKRSTQSSLPTLCLTSWSKSLSYRKLPITAVFVTVAYLSQTEVCGLF